MNINYIDLLKMDADESKYYIALKCNCGSAVIWGGKDDHDVKTCFFCKRIWKRIEDGNEIKVIQDGIATS